MEGYTTKPNALMMKLRPAGLLCSKITSQTFLVPWQFALQSVNHLKIGVHSDNSSIQLVGQAFLDCFLCNALISLPESLQLCILKELMNSKV